MFIFIDNKPAAIAQISQSIYLPSGSSIIASGLSAGDSIALEVQANKTFVPALDASSAAVVLTSANSQLTIDGSAIYRINCPSTVAAVSVVAHGGNIQAIQV